MLEGLSTGFTKSLNLVGVGYRATLGSKELTLNLGYSLPVVMQIPEGIEVQVKSCLCSAVSVKKALRTVAQCDMTRKITLLHMRIIMQACKKIGIT